MSRLDDRMNNIKRYGKRAIGRVEILNFLNGARLTRNEAILAKCYECCGYYADGKTDCRIETCPLHQYNPFRKNAKP